MLSSKPWTANVSGKRNRNQDVFRRAVEWYIFSLIYCRNMLHPIFVTEIYPLGVQAEDYSCVSTGLSFFFIGAIVGLMPSLIYLAYYLFRKKKNTIPSSPHYMTAEQNPYISVPTREKMPKKPTGSSLYPSNGTVKSIKCYVDDYEIPTMTLKRNSHEVRNGHSKQYESDKFLYD